MSSSVEKPLWQLGLDWLLEYNGGGTHDLDRERVRKLARGLRMVGERPALGEVGRYAAELWDVWPHAARMVRDTWRSVDRAKTSVGRDTHWVGTPLYVVDFLIEQHGVSPSLEERLAAVARDASQALVTAAAGVETAAYLDRRRELAATVIIAQHLRFLRHGSGGLGFANELNPLPAPRPSGGVHHITD